MEQLSSAEMENNASPTSSRKRGVESMVSFSRKDSSGSGGSGNNSDNSAICSIGYNSFGFNFDADEGIIATNEEHQDSLIPTREEQQDSQAADTAVANLALIASEAHATSTSKQTAPSESIAPTSNQGIGNPGAVVSLSSSEENRVPPSKKAKTHELDEDKREERNAREKERSFRISKQINELRNLLSSGGVIVPKGTKSSVLTEAANYIRMLQQHQYSSEIERHQLVQQLQMIGSGSLGPQAAQAIRHVAAQNGVWSLGNFGGLPPKSALSVFHNDFTGSNPDKPGQCSSAVSAADVAPLQTKIEDPEYRCVFNSCSVGMAIASMGGAFIDSNYLFSQLSNYNKQEICSMTIFNLTSREDLQHAFDLISQMIAPPLEGQGNPRSCVLRGAMRNRLDIGLSVALVKGDDGISKCFCVTLIKNPASPFDTSQPVPATADMIIAPIEVSKDRAQHMVNTSPTYTAG